MPVWYPLGPAPSSPSGCPIPGVRPRYGSKSRASTTFSAQGAPRVRRASGRGPRAEGARLEPPRSPAPAGCPITLWPPTGRVGGQHVQPAGLVGDAREALEKRAAAAGTHPCREADPVATDQPAAVGHLRELADVAHADVVRRCELHGRVQHADEPGELADHLPDLRDHVGDLRDLVGEDDRVAGDEQVRLPAAGRPHPCARGHHQTRNQPAPPLLLHRDILSVR